MADASGNNRADSVFTGLTGGRDNWSYQSLKQAEWDQAERDVQRPQGVPAWRLTQNS